MTNNSLNPDLKKTLKKDKEYLETTQLPIITVSATYREDLKGFYDLPENDQETDIVFSRAHYSMALAAAIEQWGKTLDPKKAWIVDPTNYVSVQDWSSIQLTDFVGKTIARHPLLKTLKDFIDKFGRSKLPILKPITPPLSYLTKNIEKPILSFHIASGNILVELGKQIIQVVTDPHVREDYLTNAEKNNIKFCVFDEKTKIELLEKAAKLEKEVDPSKVIVTGPPIDPRIIKHRDKKKPWDGKRPLRICLTTGGIGTNKSEIKDIVRQLSSVLQETESKYQLMVYAGTHTDIKDAVIEMAEKNMVPVKLVEPTDPADFEMKANLNEPLPTLSSAPLTLLYHPQVVDANELLIKYAFPWADGFITKPSGDMAYDAVAAGCFLLTLQEWGEWELNIRQIFEGKSISIKADTDDIVSQLKELEYMGWFKNAMYNASNIEKLFLEGAEEIVKTAISKY